MFDFSFGEIGLVAVVALLVLGPERLPKVARTAGALLRRARSSWQNVREEIERELEAEDLKRSIREIREAATDLRNDVHNTAANVHSEIKASTDDVENLAKPSQPAAVESTSSLPATESTGTPDERH